MRSKVSKLSRPSGSALRSLSASSTDSTFIRKITPTSLSRSLQLIQMSGCELAESSFKRRTFDTLIVAGGIAIPAATPGLLKYLRSAAHRTGRIASICTGALILAEAGLLDGRRATTHWQFARDMQRDYPRIAVEEDRIFTIDGPIWTSAGMSAAIDLALALVEKDLGAEIARLVAKILVVYHRRSGGQSQFSTLLDLDVLTFFTWFHSPRLANNRRRC